MRHRLVHVPLFYVDHWYSAAQEARSSSFSQTCLSVSVMAFFSFFLFSFFFFFLLLSLFFFKKSREHVAVLTWWYQQSCSLLHVLVQPKLRGSIDHSNTRVARQGTGIAVVKVLHDLTSTNVMVSESATRQDYPAYKLHARYSVAICGLTYSSKFFSLPHKRHDFRRRLWNVKPAFWFSLNVLSETFLVIRTQRDTVINVHRSSCKVPVIIVRF